MNIIQNNKDGSADIKFSEEEIKLIKEKGKLHFDPVAFKHVVNALSRMLFTFTLNFPEDTKNIMSDNNTKVDGK